jgi:hypothetical protein
MKTNTNLNEQSDNEVKKSKKNYTMNEISPTKNDNVVDFGRYLMKKMLNAINAKEFDYLYNTLTSTDVAYAIGKAFKQNEK